MGAYRQEGTLAACRRSAPRRSTTPSRCSSCSTREAAPPSGSLRSRAARSARAAPLGRRPLRRGRERRASSGTPTSRPTHGVVVATGDAAIGDALLAHVEERARAQRLRRDRGDRRGRRRAVPLARGARAASCTNASSCACGGRSTTRSRADVAATASPCARTATPTASACKRCSTTRTRLGRALRAASPRRVARVHDRPRRVRPGAVVPRRARRRARRVRTALEGAQRPRLGEGHRRARERARPRARQGAAPSRTARVRRRAASSASG